MTIEIFYADLSPTKQAEVLEAYQVSSPDEMSWDNMPIIVMEVDPPFANLQTI